MEPWVAELFGVEDLGAAPKMSQGHEDRVLGAGADQHLIAFRRDAQPLEPQSSGLAMTEGAGGCVVAKEQVAIGPVGEDFEGRGRIRIEAGQGQVRSEVRKGGGPLDQAGVGPRALVSSEDKRASPHVALDQAQPFGLHEGLGDRAASHAQQLGQVTAGREAIAGHQLAAGDVIGDRLQQKPEDRHVGAPIDLRSPHWHSANYAIARPGIRGVDRSPGHHENPSIRDPLVHVPSLGDRRGLHGRGGGRTGLGRGAERGRRGR